MTALIIAAIAVALYLLGTAVMKELVDLLEENSQDFLPRPYTYWSFILTWPYQAIKGLTDGDE